MDGRVEEHYRNMNARRQVAVQHAMSLEVMSANMSVKT